MLILDGSFKEGIAGVKFFAEERLPFRGHSEIFGQTDYGSFMGVLEIIAEFDPFLKAHIDKYGNTVMGTLSYLSSTTCLECIEQMGEQVLAEIIRQIKVAKYFPIRVDSTPDVTHIALRVKQKTCPDSVQAIYSGHTEIQKKKNPADEATEPDCEQSSRDRFRAIVFIAAIDRLLDEMDRRYHSYTHVQHTFGFLNNIPSISTSDICSGAADLQRKYSGDLEEDFVDEIGQLREFNKGQNDTSAMSLLNHIRGKRLESVFPNVDIALRLFLTLPITNTTGERSFSILGLVNNKLRSTMGKNRLNHLSLMNIENDILRKQDFTSLIKDFSSRKTRKRSLGK
ncbi:uncharacterized protein [Lepeophtheirus salmonis]|uniref:uncharacterized protein n=1 Tax=Lepeophtheirus salmonis TaxID=72036 RepID=UPI003AF40019